MSDKLPVHITNLEMTHPLDHAPPIPTRPTVALMHAKHIPVSYYRYLYEAVGKPHHWEERRLMNDNVLDTIINDENRCISILYAEGCPAGFYEIDLADSPNSAEIKYIGLTTDYQGMGLGKWLIATAIRTAWSYKPEKLVVETNTLDHPAALHLYQFYGFSPISIADAEVTPWQ